MNTELKLVTITESELRAIVSEETRKAVAAALLEKDAASNQMRLLNRRESFSIKETADILGVSKTTLHNWTKEGAIKKTYIKERPCYLSSDIKKLLDR